MKRIRTSFCLILIVLSSLVSCSMDESLIWSSFLEKDDNRTEDEIFEQAAKNLVSVTESIDPFFLGSASAAEMSGHLEEIKQIKGVVDAYSTPTCVFVDIKDWGKIGYCFDTFDNWQELNTKAFNQIKSKASELPVSKGVSKINGNYSACIMNAQHQERAWTREVVNATEDMFKEVGIKVDVYNYPTLDFFREDIFDYNLVFVIAHGIYDDESNSHWIQTSEKVKADNLYTNFQETFKSLWHYLVKTDQVRFTAFKDDHYGEDKTVFRYTISEAFIKNSSNSFDDFGKAVLFMVPCQTLMGNSMQHIASNNELRDIDNSMAKAFFDKGAGMYIGYDESSSGLAQFGGMRFFANLLCGDSFENALIMPDSDDILTYLHNYDTDPKNTYVIDPNSTYYKEYCEKFFLDKNDPRYGTIERQWHVARHVLTSNGFQMDSFIVSPNMTTNEFVSEDGYLFTAKANYCPDVSIINLNSKPSFSFDRTQYGFVIGTGSTPASGKQYPATVTRNPKSHEVDFQLTLPFDALQEKTDYFVWPYIADGSSYNYGDMSTFTTGSLTVPVSSVYLDKTSLTLDVDDIATLTATVLPENATDKNVTWSSDKKYVATVSSTGEVTAVSPGTAVITVTTIDGGFTATCTVEVNPVPIDVTVTTLDATDVAIKKATVSGEYLYDGEGLNILEQGFVYSSSNTSPALSIAGCRSIAAEQTGTSFSATITDLEPLTTYHVVAYMVVNPPYGERQTFYGNVVSFVTDPLKNVIPEEIIDKMDDHMPIYDGINPPVVEGQYLMSKLILVYSTYGHSPGDTFNDLYLHFYNQDITNNTLEYSEDEPADDGSSSGTGTGAFISGEGDDFSIFFNVEGQSVYSGYTINTKIAVIISGTRTDKGIKDMYYSFVMLDKSSDPSSHIVPVGTYRVFKDKDGLSEFTNHFSTKTLTRTGVKRQFSPQLPSFILDNLER